MASFTPTKINLSEINNGNKIENGDIVKPEYINAPIEASAYAQSISDEAKTLAQTALDRVNDTVGGTVKLSAYPLGSIYISTAEINPASLFSGTWEKIKDKFLIGASDTYRLGDDGGSPDAVVVEHFHSGIYYNTNVEKDRQIRPEIGTESLVNGFVVANAGKSANTTSSFVTGNAGESGVGKNLPPYLAVNIWRRIG